MISFELTGPLTLETFTDHDDDGSHGGNIEPGRTTKKAAQNGNNQDNESDGWECKKNIACQEIQTKRKGKHQ